MYFTQEDYRKIENWLSQRSVKDTQFPSSDPLNGTEKIPILQDKVNKTIGLDDFTEQLKSRIALDIYNVTSHSCRSCLKLKEAISLVPVKSRKLGLIITYHSDTNNWAIYQFKGTSLNQWSSEKYWSNLHNDILEGAPISPDEEDITSVEVDDNRVLKFKDKSYDPSEFSGKGRIILRKNLAEVEAVSIDSEDTVANVLTQDMIRESNTIYIIQYDFDLNSKVITIPEGCVLWFQGGSLNNGTVYLQDTAVLGAFRLSDIGEAKVLGNFKAGQIMSFTNKYDDTKQELRWFNGNEWILILDITDYENLGTEIADIVSKYNLLMTKVSKVETDITELKNTIKNLTSGATSVTVNGKKYIPDDNGSIVLPDYPEESEGYDDTQLKERVQALEDMIVQLSTVTHTIQLDKGQDTFQIEVQATDVHGEEQSPEYDVSASDSLTVE